MKQKIKQLAGIFVLGAILYIGARSTHALTLCLGTSAGFALHSLLDAITFIILYYFAHSMYKYLDDKSTQQWAALVVNVLPLLMLIVLGVQGSYFSILPNIEVIAAFVLPLLLMKQPKYVKFGLLATIALYFIYMMAYGNEHLFLFINTYMM